MDQLTCGKMPSILDPAPEGRDDASCHEIGDERPCVRPCSRDDPIMHQALDPGHKIVLDPRMQEGAYGRRTVFGELCDAFCGMCIAPFVCCCFRFVEHIGDSLDSLFFHLIYGRRDASIMCQERLLADEGTLSHIAGRDVSRIIGRQELQERRAYRAACLDDPSVFASALFARSFPSTI